MAEASVAESRASRALEELRERYRNEIMGEEERLELRERILRLEKKAGRS